MTTLIAILARACIFAGLAIMAAALLTVRSLIGQLPAGTLRRRWAIMAVLIAVFLFGYAGYLAAFWDRHLALVDLIVPTIFFLGACFVWLTGRLSLQTAMDVMRLGQLEHETRTDALTGVYNRRYLDRRLPEEVAAARRYGLPLALMLVDLDHFKQVNDEHGHQAGDQVLAEIAQLLARELRDVDVVARFGGEEFVVITPHTNPASALEVAERLRALVESHVVVLGLDGEAPVTVQVTVSIGLASFGGAISNVEMLTQAADRNLYRAKAAGRNRVIGGVDEGVAT